jgi:hypothetical protein
MASKTATERGPNKHSKVQDKLRIRDPLSSNLLYILTTCRFRHFYVQIFIWLDTTLHPRSRDKAGGRPCAGLVSQGWYIARKYLKLGSQARKSSWKLSRRSCSVGSSVAPIKQGASEPWHTGSDNQCAQLDSVTQDDSKEENLVLLRTTSTVDYFQADYVFSN